jgi:hypothetical protein
MSDRPVAAGSHHIPLVDKMVQRPQQPYFLPRLSDCRQSDIFFVVFFWCCFVSESAATAFLPVHRHTPLAFFPRLVAQSFPPSLSTSRHLTYASQNPHLHGDPYANSTPMSRVFLPISVFPRQTTLWWRSESFHMRIRTLIIAGALYHQTLVWRNN